MCILFIVYCGFRIVQKLDFVNIDLLFSYYRYIVFADATKFVAHQKPFMFAFCISYSVNSFISVSPFSLRAENRSPILLPHST